MHYSCLSAVLIAVGGAIWRAVQVLSKLLGVCGRGVRNLAVVEGFFYDRQKTFKMRPVA